eukprot:CAMPEP_0174707922 /NCGR_PEP_ID=MMETSP1094-20130205/10305_1 /TAXON_ID=156173 /ORGANISM="Chrysochromulina brevifilum, Strain UTEX LB 985" /LENGTH=113 /DNA_ID=CAMNT_0015906393 /DNA_START=841 /DNA_END=1180 /DNA_ORIENTATION=-
MSASSWRRGKGKATYDILRACIMAAVPSKEPGKFAIAAAVESPPTIEQASGHDTHDPCIDDVGAVCRSDLGKQLDLRRGDTPYDIELVSICQLPPDAHVTPQEDRDARVVEEG